MQAPGLRPNWFEIESRFAQLQPKNIAPFNPDQIKVAIKVLQRDWDQYAARFTRENKKVLHIKVVSEITIRCLISDKGQIYIIHKGNKSPKIDSGENRCVRNCLCLNSMELTAVKISTMCFKEGKDPLNEVKMFQSAMVKGNPLFVQMRDYCIYPSKRDSSVQKLAIVTEWCNLKDAIYAYNEMSKSDFIQVIPFCFRVLSELDKFKTLHRDIKLDNIFVHRSFNGVVTFKLGDFGTSNTQKDELSFINRNDDVFIGGTRRLMSPEVIKFNSLYEMYFKHPAELIEMVCSLSTDVWSVGVLIFDLLYSKYEQFPTKSEDIEKLKQSDVNRILDDCFEKKPWCSEWMSYTTQENLFQCIRGMLRVDPKERLSGPALHKLYNKSI